MVLVRVGKDPGKGENSLSRNNICGQSFCTRTVVAVPTRVARIQEGVFSHALVHVSNLIPRTPLIRSLGPGVPFSKPLFIPRCWPRHSGDISASIRISVGYCIRGAPI